MRAQASSYGFTHGKLRKAVDTSVPFRFSGLDSNCQLDLVRARDGSSSAGGKGGPVRVALQLPSGRFVVRHRAVVACEKGCGKADKSGLGLGQGTFTSQTTLWEIAEAAVNAGRMALAQLQAVSAVCVCDPCTVCADCC